MSNLFDDFLNNPIVGTVATALAVAAVALWIAAAWWTWRDAGRRSDSSLIAFTACGWIILSTPLLLPLALAVYVVARPPRMATDERTDRLIAALAASTAADSSCPSCANRMDAGWVRCPVCATWLAAPCSSCGEWSQAGLELCPYCGREGHAAPAVEEQAAAIIGLEGARRAPQMAAAVARRVGA